MTVKKKAPVRPTKRASRGGRVVALTGPRTFVGRRLLAELQRDPIYSQIILLDREQPPGRTDKTTFYRVDLTAPTIDADIAKILEREKVDTFVHLAFKTSPAHDNADAHELENIGTMYVLNACAQHRVRKFVLGSTTYCYGAEPLHPNYLTETHALAARGGAFVRDKVEAERQVARFKEENPKCVTTVLRPCTVIGPTIDNFATRFLARRLVPNMMGFDPLVQFLHEDDLVAGFKRAVDIDADGAFNLVGDGVMALSTVFALTGAISVPVPYTAARIALGLLWAAELVEAPPDMLHFLRYLCVADGAKQKEKLGFFPQYSSRDALQGFSQTQRLRRIRLPHMPLEAAHV